MIDDATLIAAGKQYGVPPAILYGISSQGNPPGFEAMARNYGFDPAQVATNPVLMAQLIAANMSENFARYGNWDSAISAYASGDPGQVNNPISDTGGFVTASLAVASSNAELGLDSMQGGPLWDSMTQDFGQHMDRFAKTGGVITPDMAQAYHISADQSSGKYSDPQFSQGLQEAARNNGQSYTSGQCTWYAARSLGFIPGGLGNAGDWVQRASQKGMTVTHVPTVGTAVVYAPDSSGGGVSYSPVGHVAVVTGVNPDGTFTISEMNMNEHAGVADTRVSTMGGVIGFIQAPPGTDMATAAPGLHAEMTGQAAPAPKQAQQPKAPPPDPQAHEIGAFAQQAAGLGLSPNDFDRTEEYMKLRRRQGLQAGTMEDFAPTKGLPPMEMANHIASLSHPIYPEMPVGEFNRIRGMADLHAQSIAQRGVSAPEVVQFWQAQAGNSDMRNYFQTQATDDPSQKPGGPKAF